METEAPFLLGSCDGSGRSYCVKRKCDDSVAGYICQTEEGRWKLLDLEEKDYEDIPAFPLRHEAALFLYMRGKVYQAVWEVHINRTASSERIRIRVSPNWHGHGCVLGQWAASLHHEDGRSAGLTRCAVSVAEAKAAGVQQARCGAITWEEARSRSELLPWQESADPSPTAV